MNGSGQRPARWRSLGPREGRPGPRPGRGQQAPGLCQAGPTPGTKARDVAGARTPGPTPRKAGSRSGSAQAAAAARPRGQPAGSRTRWAQACLRPHGSALLPPRLRCSLQANPSTRGTHRETEVRSDCVHTRGPWGSPRLPAVVSYLNGRRLTQWSQRQLLTDRAQDTAREGRALGPSGGGRRGRPAEVEGSFLR